MSNSRKDRKRKNYRSWPITEEVREKLEAAKRETEGMEMRPILCPKCKKKQFYAGSDIRSGHISIKCSRCGEEFVMPLSHFHTRAGRRRPWNAGYLNAR